MMYLDLILCTCIFNKGICISYLYFINFKITFCILCDVHVCNIQCICVWPCCSAFTMCILLMIFFLENFKWQCRNVLCSYVGLASQWRVHQVQETDRSGHQVPPTEGKVYFKKNPKMDINTRGKVFLCNSHILHLICDHRFLTHFYIVPYFREYKSMGCISRTSQIWPKKLKKA